MQSGPFQCGRLTRGAVIVSTRLALGFVMSLGAAAVPAQVNCNPGIAFYAEGSVKQCHLNGHHRLYTARGDGVVCADGYSLVQFADGSLRGCHKIGS